MKRSALFTALGAAALLMAPATSHARTIPQLQRFFDQKLDAVEAAISNSTGAAPGEKPIVLENINVDLIPTVSFGVSGVLDLRVMPEIDFVLQPDEPL
jgi:hypothetical protein